MALECRQVVKKIEIHNVIFMDYLYSNIDIKCIELKKISGAILKKI